jgi:hypothetical protein
LFSGFAHGIFAALLGFVGLALFIGAFAAKAPVLVLLAIGAWVWSAYLRYLSRHTVRSRH